MRSFAIIDLHCDTLTNYMEYADDGSVNSLDDPQRALSLSAIPSDVHWAQFFAIFTPDEKKEQAAVDFYEENRLSFERQMGLFSDRVMKCRNAADMESAWAAGKTAAFLTVENGNVLAGDISRVKTLAEDGVRAMTIVWNGENEIGSGHTTSHGLSEFGKKVVKELEKQNIIVDVSHLNDTGFSDLLKIAEKPFAATHSNARAICAHKRNLTDDMIREMVKRDCLIGLNYFVDFIRDDKNVQGYEDLYRHVLRFFELGAAKNLALGSDFDGADLPECLSSPEKVMGFYDYMLSRGLTKDEVDGIFYKNAQLFFRKNLI